ncbi:MAG: hypothetical protein ACR2MX_06360 [Cyclobacteriaceae bacterium]
MYKSRFEIERKLKQIHYIHNELKAFQDRVFVNFGLDPITGCNPIEIKLASFILSCRSIFQYALKEIHESDDSLNKTKYDLFINQNKIIGFFLRLSDHEIHSIAVSMYGALNFEGPIRKTNKETGVAVWETATTLNFEPLDDLYQKKNTDSERILEYQIAKRQQVTPNLIARLEKEGKYELVHTARSNKVVLETLEFNRTSDLFVLCHDYLESTKSFIKYGINEGMIS